MDRSKWVRTAIVQLSAGALVLGFYYCFDVSPMVRHAAVCFYAGFSVITLLLIFLALYSKNASDAPKKAGRALMAVGLKFLLTLILLVIYLAYGGFRSGEEALVIVPMYVIFSWLAYHLANN